MVEVTAEEDLPTMIAGDDSPYSLQFRDADSKDPLPLDSITVDVFVKESSGDDDSDAIIHKEITSHTDPVLGETFFKFETADTEGLSGNYPYKIRITLPNDDERTVVEGTAYFKEV